MSLKDFAARKRRQRAEDREEGELVEDFKTPELSTVLSSFDSTSVRSRLLFLFASPFHHLKRTMLHDHGPFLAGHKLTLHPIPMKSKGELNKSGWILRERKERDSRLSGMTLFYKICNLSNLIFRLSIRLLGS